MRKINLAPEIKFLVSLALLVAILAFAFWLSVAASDNQYVQEIITRYGYFGIFAAAVVSGFNLVVPIPAVSFIPALIESGLNFWTTILILSLGMTIADVAAYILGRAGRGGFSHALNQKVMQRLNKLRDKHQYLPLGIIFLFASIVPFPNEIIVVPLGFLRYRMTYLIGAVFLGNIIFNTLYSKGFLELFRILY